jgi:ABC-type lipoprotein export system ATPase subunit
METNKYMVECENLMKIYKTRDLEVIALQGLDLTVETGELTAIIGNSGSGKSTLLNMLGGLDKPTAGRLEVGGSNMLKLNSRNRKEYMRNTVGFVWQNNARNLLPYLTAVQNVELPLLFSGNQKSRQRALELLDMVGLLHRKDNKLSQLSGGEQQRVAIAIALSNNPKLLLADEPTGSVDSKTTAGIMEVFHQLKRDTGVTILIVTHDRNLARMVDRVVAIRDGRTSAEFIRKSSYVEELRTVGNLGAIDSLGTMDADMPFVQQEDTHEELIVVDKVGRLQLPQEYMKRLGISGKSKIKADFDNGKVMLYLPEDGTI